MKRFQLLIDEDTYEKFSRYYFGHGIRQTVLRRAVHELIKRAEKKYKATGQVFVNPDDLLEKGDIK